MWWFHSPPARSDPAISPVVRTDPGLPCLRSDLVRVTQPCVRSATRDWPSENITSRHGRPSRTGVAATTVVGWPASSKTWSPARSSPMHRQPPGVGTGVSIASALPSSRPAISSGRLTTS